MDHAASPIDPTKRMTRDEYRAWAARQPRGRFERIDGEVVAMGPERLRHVRTKYAVWRALDAALRTSGSSCEVLGDGATVSIDDGTDYEPDAVVNCGPRADDDLLAVPNTVVVVEVSSTGTQHVDTGVKLADYFGVESIRHYLIVGADQRLVIHHRRGLDGILTAIVRAGVLTLDPPGITVGVNSLYG